MRVKDAVGRYGEQVAVAHLSAAGLQVIARNWRCRDGEVDVIARDADTIVFVEVKTRSSDAYGLPAQAVGPVKAARIRRLALLWLEEHRAEVGYPPVRFDVVAVLRRAGGPADVQHLAGAF